jgi:ParB family chromosome partitioning protein
VTATIDGTASDMHDDDISQTGQPREADVPGQPAGRPMIATALLTEHPGNVREDLDLDEEFLDSIAFEILDPLRITPDGAGGYRVIDGHRRLAAAVARGVPEVPYDLAADREHDQAGQFLDMFRLHHHRKDLTALEEAGALFAASNCGASKTRIRKATGLDKDQLATALKAGSITGYARETAAGSGHAITLEQVALLAEFENDEEAVNRIMNDLCSGRSGQHAAELIRQEHAEAAEHERLVAQLLADGYTVTGEQPPNGCILHSLQHDGQEITPEAHAACPGRGAYFNSYQPLQPRHYCTEPEANGHASRYQSTPLPDLSGSASDDYSRGEADGHSHGHGDPGDGAEARAQRKLVIDGNKAWAAACTVRRQWLAGTLLARRTAPKEAMPFITCQLLAMPQALRDAVARAPGSQLFRQITGGAFKPSTIDAWAPGRLPLALLAVIATAYEDRMDGPEGRKTWRTDQRYTQCDRGEAGFYLRFLASTGYELAPIEQAVADGVPYTGDHAGDELRQAGAQDGDGEVPETEDTSADPGDADGGQDAGDATPAKAA